MLVEILNQRIAALEEGTQLEAGGGVAAEGGGGKINVVVTP